MEKPRTLEELQKGNVYMTKTRHYLNPLLRVYGKEFLDRLRNVWCVRSGIGDFKYSKLTNKKLNNHLFLLFNAKKTANFNRYLAYIRQHESYEADYPFDHLLTGNLHVVVYKLPKGFDFAIEQFKKSKYSKMMPVSIAQELFSDQDFGKKVILKDPDHRKEFEAYINSLSEDKDYLQIILPEEAELDEKINLQEEHLR